MLPAASVPEDFYAVFCIALLGISDLYVNVQYDNPVICLYTDMRYDIPAVIIIFIIMYLYIYVTNLGCVRGQYHTNNEQTQSVEGIIWFN